MNRFAPVFTLLLIGCVACSHEEIEQAPVVEGQTLILEAAAPADVTAGPLGTKTTMVPNEGKYSVHWSENDAISVNGVTSIQTEIDSENAKSATFIVENINYPLHAVYPAAVASGFEAASALVTLPATQKYTDGSFDPAASVMLGYVADKDDALNFSHAMAYLYISSLVE